MTAIHCGHPPSLSEVVTIYQIWDVILRNQQIFLWIWGVARKRLNFPPDLHLEYMETPAWCGHPAFPAQMPWGESHLQPAARASLRTPTYPLSGGLALLECIYVPKCPQYYTVFEYTHWWKWTDRCLANASALPWRIGIRPVTVLEMVNSTLQLSDQQTADTGRGTATTLISPRKQD